MISSISLCDACQARPRASLTAKANVAALQRAWRASVRLNTSDNLRAPQGGPHHPMVVRGLCLGLPVISLGASTQAAATGLVLMPPFSTTASSSLRPLMARAVVSANRTERNPRRTSSPLSSAPDKARPKAPRRPLSPTRRRLHSYRGRTDSTLEHHLAHLILCPAVASRRPARPSLNVELRPRLEPSY